MSKEKMTWALQRAEEMIRECTGQKVQHFAYPHGRYNEESVSEIQRRYKTAVTIEKGFAKQPGKYARQGILHSTTLENLPRLLRKPTLSVCLIVKNEEQFLEAGLASVESLADEIIVVDTGSTDKTKEIARKFTEKVFDYPWNNDFAAARNESLRHATGDWIFILDADEVLAAHDQALFLQAINNWDVAAYRQVTRNYSSDSSIKGWVPLPTVDSRAGASGEVFFRDGPLPQHPSGWFPSVKIRLFQNNPNASLHFEGAVHELISEQKMEQSGQKLMTLPFPVHHYGTWKTDWREKSKGRIALTTRKIVESPAAAKAHFEVGVQYLASGQYLLAEQAFEHSLGLEIHSEPLYHLALTQQKQGKYEQAVENYQNVLSLRQDHADAHYGLGFCSFQQQDGAKAREHFQRAIMFNPLLVDAYVNLGAVLEQENQLAEAGAVLRKAIFIASQHARAHYNFGVVLERRGFIPKAIESYGRALSLKYPKAGLAERIEAMKKAWERASGSEERNPIVG